MKSILFIAISFVTLHVTSAGLTAFQMKLKVSKAACQPASGYADKLMACYDFHTKTPIPADECNSPKNSHCCLYKCSCILKGAGTPRGIIPQEHKPQTTLKEQFLSDCPDEDSTSQPTPSGTTQTFKNVKPTRKSTGQKRSRTKSNTPVSVGNGQPKPEPSTPASKKSTTSQKQSAGKAKSRGQISKPKRFKESKNNKLQKSSNKRKKPTRKLTRVPNLCYKTTTSTKKPCTPTKAKKSSFSSVFFSRLSSALVGFGFSSKVTQKDPCI